MAMSYLEWELIQLEREAEYFSDYHSEYWAGEIASMANEGSMADHNQDCADDALKEGCGSHVELFENHVWEAYAKAGFPGRYEDFKANWGAK